MPYELVDVEVTRAAPPLQLGERHTGVALISRRHGHVVGFAMHEQLPGARLGSDDVEGMLDPAPGGDPPDPGPWPAPAPTITVAICTRDRTELLEQCLGALLEQVSHPDEIVVVDNAPPGQDTRDLVSRLGVRYELEACPGLDFARNRALRAAHGDVVAYVDDDVVPDVHWLTSLRAVWRQHPDAGAVTGQILPRELSTSAQVAFERRGGFRGGNEQLRFSGTHLDGDAVYPYGPGMFGAGANLSVRRDVALRLGAFDEALDTGPPLPGGGDIDMMHRVLRAGFPLVYEPRAVVFHRHRRDAEGLRRQYDSWGRSVMAFVDKTYRRDPEGREKLRLFVRWFFTTQLRQAVSAARTGDEEARDAAVAELRGGAAGLFGTYGRSRRRSRRVHRIHGRPTIAMLPWGDVVEDYLEPIGLSLDDYADRMAGGWLFGFAEAFHRAGVDTVIVCWSRTVSRPTRRIHIPTGATLWILPPSRLYSGARARLADPYAWDRRGAVRQGPRGAMLAGALARVAAPYLTTTPASLSRVLRGEGCRAILCQEYEEGRFDLCTGIGRALGVPVFATFQGGDRTRTLLERRVRRRTVRSADGLIVAAAGEAERVRQRYGVPTSRIAPIANPFDPATVPLRPRTEARAALGIDLAARVAVWHGRVDIVPKGIDTLLDAWMEVRSSCATPPTLLLLGTGSGAPWLAERLSALGLDDVRWRNEYVLDRSVIGTYLSAADVFVLPSRQEGFPVAPIEAMAAGLPVVATDAPGVRAVVGEGATSGGVVVPREDAHALATELRRLLDDAALSATVGERAARRVTERFSLDAVGAQLRSFVLR